MATSSTRHVHRFLRFSAPLLALRRLQFEGARLFRTKGGPQLKQVSCIGLNMVVPTNEDVGAFIDTFGYFERRDSLAFANLIKPDDVCIDVGANAGYYTLLFALLAPSGQVHSFEPVPRNFLLLLLNSEINSLTNVFANQVALSDRCGAASFELSSDSAYSGFHASRTTSDARSIHVDVVTLDKYIQVHQMTHVDVIKVDIEGAEMSFLRGATTIFSNRSLRPRVLMLELCDRFLAANGSSLDEVVAFMRQHDYAPYWADRDGGLSPLSVHIPFSTSNVFFQSKY